MENASSAELNVREGGISAVSVKLRGLPFKALEQDISDFFEGYDVQRALLKRYPDGRPNGEVLGASYQLVSVIHCGYVIPPISCFHHSDQGCLAA